MTLVIDPQPTCHCTHAKQIHTPTGRLDDTRIRGEGPCTAGVWGYPCLCDGYKEKHAA